VRTLDTDQSSGPKLSSCLACGNEDLWRQKDFPVALGLFMVALGAVLFLIAQAYYRPGLAYGVLILFAAIDMLLYLFMPDALVCYRCHARLRITAETNQFSAYDHELGEKYRQDRIRLEEAEDNSTSSHPD